MLKVKSGDDLQQQAFQHASVTTKSDKVEQHFTQSATTYHRGAQLQHKVANALFTQLAQNTQGRSKSEHGLDLGCGPGLFTRDLADKTHQLTSFDLSADMLAQVPEVTLKVRGDSHHLPFEEHRFDWVFSSLMIQWCEFETVLEQIHRVLKPGGKAYISTLIQGSLYELAQAWTAVDNDQHIHQYLSMEAVITGANKGPWQSIKIDQHREVLWFEQVKALAKELKLLGANYVQGRKNKGLMTKSKWRAMEQAYHQEFFCHQRQAIPASYQVVLLELTK